MDKEKKKHKSGSLKRKERENKLFKLAATKSNKLTSYFSRHSNTNFKSLESSSSQNIQCNSVISPYNLMPTNKLLVSIYSENNSLINSPKLNSNEKSVLISKKVDDLLMPKLESNEPLCISSKKIKI